MLHDQVRSALVQSLQSLGSGSLRYTREWLLTRLMSLIVWIGISTAAIMINSIMAIRPAVVAGVMSPNPTVANAYICVMPIVQSMINQSINELGFARDSVTRDSNHTTTIKYSTL